MEEVGAGDFVGFGHVVAGEEEMSGRGTTVDALDLRPSERDAGAKQNRAEAPGEGTGARRTPA